MGSSELSNLLAAYSGGALDLLGIEECSGLWCGEILAALAERGLPLPTVDSVTGFNPAQLALHAEIFS
jgi:hypothetical protein